MVGVFIARAQQLTDCFVLSDSLKLYLVQVRTGAGVRGKLVAMWNRKEGGEAGSNTSVQLAPSRPLSAEFVFRVVLVQQFDVCEGKVATFAFTFTLPLAVHVYFGHLHHITHLGRDGREKGCKNRPVIK